MTAVSALGVNMEEETKVLCKTEKMNRQERQLYIAIVGTRWHDAVVNNEERLLERHVLPKGVLVSTTLPRGGRLIPMTDRRIPLRGNFTPPRLRLLTLMMNPFFST